MSDAPALDVSPAPLRLVAAGMEPDALAELADRTGIGIELDPEPAGRVEAVGEGEAERLAEALNRRSAAVVEVVAGRAFPADRLRAAMAEGCRLFLSLSTRMAWSFDTAAQFCDALAVRGLLPDYLRHDVELSLHEAVVNAVLHGNLAMGGSLVDDPAEFDAFCQRLTARLAEGEGATKRVELAAFGEPGLLVLRVHDEGAGYDPELVPRPVDITAKSGRGLEIMRTMSARMEVTDGGRTVALAFAL